MNSQNVYVVDDDEAVRDALTQLLGAAGLEVVAFESGAAFLSACTGACGGCVLLDVAMPGLDGLDVQAELARRGIDLPVIFLTGHGNVPMSVRAMRAGAIDFLEKPIDARALIARVKDALALDAQRQREAASAESVRGRFESLTPRERDVMRLAAAGLANKDIARELGISYRTVEIHRGRVMTKMKAGSLVELAEQAKRCDLAPAPALSPRAR